MLPLFVNLLLGSKDVAGQDLGSWVCLDAPRTEGSLSIRAFPKRGSHLSL